MKQLSDNRSESETRVQQIDNRSDKKHKMSENFNNSNFLKFCSTKGEQIENEVNKTIDPNIINKMLNICDNDVNYCIHQRKLKCIPCQQYINIDIKHGDKTYFRHTNCASHLKNCVTNSNKRKSTEDLSKIVGQSNSKKDFTRDLTNAFMAANIPLEKLNNKVLRVFLQDYCGENVNTASNLRSHYVDECYNSLKNKVNNEIGGKDIFIELDETTDREQRSVLNVMVGVIDGEPNKPMLLDTKFLKETNSDSVCEALKQTIETNRLNFDKIVHCVTDAAPSMKKAVRKISEICPRMKSITCLAHHMH